MWWFVVILLKCVINLYTCKYVHVKYPAECEQYEAIYARVVHCNEKG